MNNMNILMHNVYKCCVRFFFVNVCYAIAKNTKFT